MTVQPTIPTARRRDIRPGLFWQRVGVRVSCHNGWKMRGSSGGGGGLAESAVAVSTGGISIRSGRKGAVAVVRMWHALDAHTLVGRCHSRVTLLTTSLSHKPPLHFYW